MIRSATSVAPGNGAVVEMEEIVFEKPKSISPDGCDPRDDMLLNCKRRMCNL